MDARVVLPQVNIRPDRRWGGAKGNKHAGNLRAARFVCLGMSRVPPPAAVLIALGAAFAQAPRSPLGAAAWREDLKVFAAKFEASGIQFKSGLGTRGQKDLDKLYPTLKADLATLDADLPNLSDQEITLRLIRIVASGNVAHNTVNMGFFRRLPIRMFWYSDGLAIIEAAQEYSDAVGARVLRIGGMTPEEALEAVTPYVAHENQIGLHTAAPAFLITRPVLQHLKLLDSADHVLLTLQKPGGAPFTLAISTDDPRVPRLDLAAAAQVPTPLYLTQPDSYYWYSYLPDSQTFYIQYNRCENDPKRRFADFVRTAMADADTKAAAHMVKRVVVDLRLNGGGDSRVVEPLNKALAARAKALGPLYILIGQYTFSSGQMAAIELHDDLHATTVGSPTAEKPNSYGDIDIITLPHSKLRISFSTKYFQLAKQGDPTELDPEVPVKSTLADALSGRDPVLEAAIRGR